MSQKAEEDLRTPTLDEVVGDVDLEFDALVDPNDIMGSEKMFIDPPFTITKPGCILTFYNGINRSDVHRGYKENENPEVLKIPGTEFRSFKWKQDTLFWGLHQGEIYFLPKKIF